MANRIVVVVSGGVVQGIYADDSKHLSVEVIDCDNLEDIENDPKCKELGGIDGYIDWSTLHLKPVDFF